MTIFSCLFGLSAENAFAQVDRNRPETLIRIYDLNEIVRTAQDYPLPPHLLPPSHLREVASPADQLPPQGARGRAEREAEAYGPRLMEIVRAIRDNVDPESWDVTGFASSVGGRLIVQQTEETHRKIEDLLNQLGPARMVTVQAWWIRLDAEQLRELLMDGEPGREGVQPINVAAFADMGPDVVAYRGRTTGYDAQTVHVAAGISKTVVTDLEPVVATQIATFDPSTRIVTFGAALQVRPRILMSADAAVLDVHTIVSEEIDPDANTDEKIAPVAVDRLWYRVHELRTTLRTPIAQPVLVGGLTMPGEEADGTQLYLIVEVLADHAD